MSGIQEIRLSAFLLSAGMGVTILTALGFEHIGGYIPCALCLLQRDPYYYGIPVALSALAASLVRVPPVVVKVLLIVAGIMMLSGAGMGVYHSGVEWALWEGPATCSTSVSAVTQDATKLLGDLNHIKGPSCSEASLRVLGLSFAGWNVLASLGLAAIAFYGASRKAKA